MYLHNSIVVNERFATHATVHCDYASKTSKYSIFGNKQSHLNAIDKSLCNIMIRLKCSSGLTAQQKLND